jgi:8-oxo-dGTP pyrophosphatase MutT (NUDIX family)
MALPMTNRSWQVLDRFLEMRSRWLTLLGEHWRDQHGQTLEYWRIEKADSVIVVPIHHQQLLLPPPTYRPGLAAATWDFPGGHLPPEQSPAAAVPDILQRELGLPATVIAQLTPLNSDGWAINSSFSNQLLYGFVADIHPTAALDPTMVGQTYPTTPAGIEALLANLTCLQCRSVLLQWWLTCLIHDPF